MAKTRVTVALAGLAAAGAAAYKRRDKMAGALPGRLGTLLGGDTAPVEASDPHHRVTAPPQPSNYDAAGPVANTATRVPAPDHHPREPIDEQAEEAAAAAEAAAIGGGIPDYPGLESSSHADEAFRPLAEAGEGEGEGQELAELGLVEAAQPSDRMSDAQRQIEEAIEAQDDPFSGERPEPLAPSRDSLSEAEAAGREGAGRGPGVGGDPSGPPDDDPDGPPWSGRPAGS